MCRSVGEASALLKSIANPNRLSIVCLLLEGERSVAERERELGTPPALDHMAFE